MRVFRAHPSRRPPPGLRLTLPRCKPFPNPARPRHTLGTPAPCLVTGPRARLPIPSEARPSVLPSTDDEGAPTMTSLDPKARDTALQGALAQIERQFGKGTV